MRQLILKVQSFLILLVLVSANMQAQKSPVDMDRFIDDLMKKMTLEEKIGQLNLPVTGEITTGQAKSSNVAKRIRAGEVGGLFNLKGVERIRDVQKQAVEESRLGIPLLFGMDVIHGYETVFPIPLGLSCTWNMTAIEESARIAAIEASADGICWTFSPMVDVSRDPRWGRVSEGNGEDPFLGAEIARAMVRGYQGKDMSSNDEIMACVKHFALYGASEAGRDYNTVDMSHQRMFNEYMLPYQAAVEEGVGSVMASFNEVDGVPATGNKWLMTDVLRKQWNFDGFVVTDYTGITEMTDHGMGDTQTVAALALNAGVDMDMVSGAFSGNLENLVKENKISEKQIDEAVRNILRLKFRLGLFENPYVSTPQSVKYSPEHLAKAKQAVEQSVILLKNTNQTLPLNADEVHTVAVVGPLADAPHDQMGTWVFDGEKAHTQTPLAALRAVYGDKVRIIYEPALAYSRDKQTTGLAKAVNAAKQADVVLAFVGEESILSGEAHSLADLNLQGLQSELIEKLSQTGKPLVTVVMAGRPLTIAKEVEESDAVLYAFHPGTMGGPALADILFGKVNPSGKTPVTFPKMVGQLPMYYAHNNTGRPALEKEMLLDEIPMEAGQTSVGCRSFFLDAGSTPLFPFGYGLSYTTFSYGNLKIVSSKLTVSDTLKVSVELKNTGRYEGTEVVQLYVQDKVGSVTRPVKELKRFQRVNLQPGESKQVMFDLPVSELAFWNIDMKKVVEPGDFKLWVASDSQGGLTTEFNVAE